MRCYKIVVGGKTLFELNDKNPIAPRIRYQIQSFADNQGLAFIDVFNVEFSRFSGGAKALLDKEIEFHAWIEATPMNKLLGYKKELNTLIYKGYIINVIPNYNFGESTCITLALNQSPGSKKQDKKEVKKEKIVFSVKKGQVVAHEAQRVLRKLYPNLSIDIAKMQEMTILSLIAKTNLNQTISKVDDLIAVLNNMKFGKDNKNYLQIYRNNTQKITIALNDFSKTDIPLAYDFSISAYDLLEQPQYIDYQTIQLSVRPSGKYQITKTLRIPQTIAFNVSAISTRVPYYSEANGDYSNKLFFSGNFLIKEIWHIGDTHNIQAQQWATNIKAVSLNNTQL